MDEHELKRRITELYADELQYAIARDDEVDVVTCRARAAMRIGREMEGEDISALWLGYVIGIARSVEHAFEDDLSNGVLRIDGAVRTADLVLVPNARMRERDWLAVDERHRLKLAQHRGKFEREHEARMAIVERLRAHGGDPTTLEACPDLFPEQSVA